MRMLTKSKGADKILPGLLALLPLCLGAAERPYFVTYDHELEEPGNLEVSINPVLGVPKEGNKFLGSWTEFEYGVKGWWTTEFYLDGQKTSRDSAIFTGFRWENRFRPLMKEHWINPVLYVEFESLNGADKTLLEVGNHASADDLAESWLTTSSSVLSAPFRLSNSTYSTGLIQCSFISGRKRFSQRKPVNMALSSDVLWPST